MKSIRSKTNVLTLGCALALLGAAAGNVQASELAPGDMLFPPPAEAEPVGGTVLQTTTVPWGGSFIMGTLTSSVLSGDTSNPHGGLTFTYEFASDIDSLHETSQFTVGGFANFLADVSYDSGSTGENPVFISRSNEGGGFGTNIRFAFSSGVGPGENTALLVVQTDSLDWDVSSAAMINSEAVSGISTLAPVNVIPEPSTIGLCALGFLSLMAGKRFRSVK